MERNNPFSRPERSVKTVDRRDFILSACIHGGIIFMFLLAGVLFKPDKTVSIGGGEFVTVQMIVLEQGDTPSEIHEPVESIQEVQEEVQEVLEEPVQEEVQEEIQEVVEEPLEEVEELVEVQEEQIEEIQEEAPQTSDFIGVGSQGEAGSGAPGPASYEGRVFSAIRRSFRTSVNPSRSYRISYTVNLDGTTSYQIIRNSGDSSFDRAVTHAINSASIPPVPPGRTQPVNLNIEFFGPDME